MNNVEAKQIVSPQHFTTYLAHITQDYVTIKDALGTLTYSITQVREFPSGNLG